MARINLVNIYGRVARRPSTHSEDGRPVLGMVYVDTVRSFRKVEDKKHYIPHETPLILSREPEQINKMKSWDENDIVLIKGVLKTTGIDKASYCPYCKNEDGTPTVNYVKGTLVTVEPIHMIKIKSYGNNKQAAIEDIIENKEISNYIQIYGTLLKNPKLYTTKNGLHITQYPVAMNRKYTIRTDDPSVKTDYPMVKSYGEQALSDRTYLQYQAEVLLDGYLQARNVKRKVTCPVCGKYHEFQDRMMEIVPYAVEYIKGELTNDDIKEKTHQTAEELRQSLFEHPRNDVLEPEMISGDIEADQETDE